jgi:sigma-B regulation protein RsbU (phosphoserine phosphatase)
LNTVLIKAEGRRMIFQWTAGVDRLVHVVLEEAARIAGAEVAVLYRYNGEGKLVGSSLPGLRELTSQSEAEREPDRHRIAKQTLKTRASSVYRAGAELRGRPLERASAAILLTIPEGDVGVIVLQKAEGVQQFYDNEFYLVRSFAASFALILRGALFLGDGVYLKAENSLIMLLENTHLNQLAREADGRLRAVLDVSNVINSSRQLDEMIEAVLYSAVHVIRAESASLFMIDETTGEMVFDVITGNRTLKGMRIPQGEGIVGLCAREKKPIMVNDAVNDARVYRSVDEISRMTTRNLLACPLLIEGDCIGVIEVVNTIGRPDFSPGDLEIFSSFSDSVAIALQRRRLIDNIESANRELERSLRENKCLHRVTATMVEARTVAELFNGVLSVLTDELTLHRASIMLYDAEKDRLRISASVGLPMFEEDEVIPRVARHVIEKRIPFYVSNISEHPDLAPYCNQSRYSSGACILIPMLEGQGDRPLGLLCVSEPANGSFHPDDFRIMVTAVSQIVKGYVSFKLSEEIIEKRAMERELEITSQLQRDILPSAMPRHDFLEVAARSIMARTTGGDFYDFYMEDRRGRLTALVADVSGKSLPATLFMAVSSSILRTMIRTEKDPAVMLRRSNDLLYEESESGMFVTVFLSQFDPERRLLRYASAGHNEMILMHRDGSYEVLRSRGAPLAVIPSTDRSYESRELILQEDDLLVLYTDGVIEAINAKNEEFGLDRFIEVLRQMRGSPLSELVERVHQEIQNFTGEMPRYDDFTLLVIRYRSPADDRRLVFPARIESIPLFVEEVARHLKDQGFSGQLLDDMMLVADEVATNICLYSFEGLPLKDPQFECILRVHPAGVSMLFIDAGREYDFEGIPEPDLQDNLSGVRRGGFGIYLIRKLMDRCEYTHHDGINYLYLEKKLVDDRKRV